jgi:hypothetical protein
MLAAALGLWVTLPAAAQEPAPNREANQQTANLVAERLRQCESLRHFHIDIAVENGTAELKGTVMDDGQRAEAVRAAQAVPGVQSVCDRLAVAGAIVPAQALCLPPNGPGGGPAGPMNLSPGATPYGGYNMPPGSASGAPSDLPPGAIPYGNGTGPSEPMPMMQGPPPNYYDLNPPKMPPYSWPTYAPYNNYSRVAYPQLYPYNAWPNVGPFYPFPKVPPGWRKVQLEWQDGFWWYSTHGNSHDWWVLRFW